MRRQGKLLAAALAAAVLLSVPAQAGAKFTKEPTATGNGGAAASVDALATKAAIDELKRGGNAIDAAVAAAGVLGVTEPFSSRHRRRRLHGHPHARTARSRRSTAARPRRRRCARTRSSTRAARPPFDNAFDTPAGAACRSACRARVATWDQALRRYGTISLRQALAAGRARRAPRLRRRPDVLRPDRRGERAWFDDVPSTAAIYLDPDGTPRDVGTTLRNPDMAKTYELHRPPRRANGFYRGPIADAIAQAASHPPIAPTADHAWRPGADDRERHRAATTRSGASRRTSTTAAWTSGAWARRRAAARPSARR